MRPALRCGLLVEEFSPIMPDALREIPSGPENVKGAILKTLDTIGDFQRPVLSLGVSQGLT